LTAVLIFALPLELTALATPQNWLFQSVYQEFREQLLFQKHLSIVAKLGEHAFDSPQAAGAFAALACLTNNRANPANRFGGFDVTEPQSPSGKAAYLEQKEFRLVVQRDQLTNPDSRIVLEKIDQSALLSKYADCLQGIKPADRGRLVRVFWENSNVPKGWKCFMGSTESSALYAGRYQTFDMATFEKEVDFIGGRLQGKKAWSKSGVSVGQMRSLPVALYSGEPFDGNAHALVPHDSRNLSAIWCFCASPDFAEGIRKLDQKLDVTNATVIKVSFDLAHWQKVAAEKYPQGLPKPFSSDPTQWLFNGHPAGADQPLQVAVARLIGYLWPRQSGSSFPDCPALDLDGLEALADDDGIVCLPPTRGESAAADRLRSLLASAFAEEWSSAKERELLLETAVANDAKKAAANLDDWLRQNFFIEHCKLFHSRPFIWQIWDGHPHGFSALVNYHKLAAPNGQGRKTLEQLTFTYLGDWIDRQKLDQAEGVNGADDRLSAALDLQGQLKKILEGQPPYDIFVRWKPLHQQATGWDPDINDGVRLNIRPFLSAQLRKGGKTGAGILRAKPSTIKWAKDRGKEPMRAKEEFPWFWGWDETNHALAQDFGASIPGAPSPGDSFDGNRWNGLHYSRAAKEAARARHWGDC
jgi:hypothetical protein